MRRPAAIWAVLAVLCAPAAASVAADGLLALDGNMVQGGLVTGSAPPGSGLTLDGKPVRVGSDGRFVFGFGRDAPAEAVLAAVLPGGTRLERRLAVRQREYRIQRIEGLPPKMVTPPPEILARIRAEGARIDAARAVFTEGAHFAAGFVWPVRGRISGVYGSQRILNGELRRPHLGVDIAAPAGTPVAAAAAGTVTLADKDLYFTGGTVVVEHGHGLSTVYSHLRDVEVKTGQRLAQGERLGTVGSTGRSTGAHLDWRINWFQERLDPMLVAGPMPE